MFKLFQKRFYKVSYLDPDGVPSAMRTTRRSVAKQMVKSCKKSGYTDIVLWRRAPIR